VAAPDDRSAVYPNPAVPDESPADRFLSLLAARDAPRIPSDRVAIIVAHPDDETIGVGGQLSRLAEATIVHVTDGAPRRHSDPAAYGQLRRRELEAAMALVGIPAHACIALGISDQEASLHLAELAERLAALLSERRIEIVLTHPYEGGHPDHDATAFAVHTACGLLSRRGKTAPAIIEMAFYHAGAEGLCPQSFVPAAAGETVVVSLSPDAWALKQRMLAAHASQTSVLEQFGAQVERFRAAPRYDFGLPPNGGAVHYEECDWGMTPARWCMLASETNRALRGPD
jgi:N-acetylglucosamine malate deacetylase 2